LFSGSSLVFPVYVFSMISGTYLYSRKFYFPYIFLFLSVIYIFFFKFPISVWRVVDISISFSMAIVLLTDAREKRYVKENEESRGFDKKVERKRDYLQIVAGGIIIILLYVYGTDVSRILITVSSLFLYLIGNFFSLRPDLALGRILYSMERKNTKLGIGSMWFASGLLMAYSFHENIYLLMVIVFVVSVSDSVATIAGTSIKSPKLFFNRKKSVAGTAAFFMVSAVFSVFLLGYIGIFYAAVASLIEGVSAYPFDDNITIPFFLSILLYLPKIV
ncbi:MAG: diacylglycerol/polyprenol kinase family protein, partial [Thermoplasmata archaeon]